MRCRPRRTVRRIARVAAVRDLRRCRVGDAGPPAVRATSGDTSPSRRPCWSSSTWARCCCTARLVAGRAAVQLLRGRDDPAGRVRRQRLRARRPGHAPDPVGRDVRDPGADDVGGRGDRRRLPAAGPADRTAGLPGVRLEAGVGLGARRRHGRSGRAGRWSAGCTSASSGRRSWPEASRQALSTVTQTSQTLARAARPPAGHVRLQHRPGPAAHRRLRCRPRTR